MQKIVIKYESTRISGPYRPFNPSPCVELFGFCKTLICLPSSHQGCQGLPFVHYSLSFVHYSLALVTKVIPSVTKVFPSITKVFPLVTKVKGFYYLLKLLNL